MTSNGTAELRCYMNLMALQGLPATSAFPACAGTLEAFDAIQAVGFDGVQFGTPGTARELSHCRGLGLGLAASGRVNVPSEADTLAQQFANDGYECATLHVGWGLEDDQQACRLIESVIEASRKWRIPLYIETHRATIFQDIWRTVQFLHQFPDVEINADFSHWYTGQEMVYGGLEQKVSFLAPVFDHVRFIHGRIGNPGCMQVRIDPNTEDEPIYVQHFKRLWTLCFESGGRICFAPELLAPDICYARTFPNDEGITVEESDRWEQSLLLKRIAEQCFEQAACNA